VEPLTEPAVYAPPALLISLLIVLWLLTGTGYFWPMWPAFGIVLAAGTFVAIRWGRRQPRGERALAIHGGLSTTLSLAMILILGDGGQRGILADLGDRLPGRSVGRPSSPTTGWVAPIRWAVVSPGCASALRRSTAGSWSRVRSAR
jgi:hypothetical protein